MNKATWAQDVIDHVKKDFMDMDVNKHVLDILEVISRIKIKSKKLRQINMIISDIKV